MTQEAGVAKSADRATVEDVLVANARSSPPAPRLCPVQTAHHRWYLSNLLASAGSIVDAEALSRRVPPAGCISDQACYHAIAILVRPTMRPRPRWRQAMPSLTWKPPEELADNERRSAPQDLETLRHGRGHRSGRCRRMGKASETSVRSGWRAHRLSARHAGPAAQRGTEAGVHLASNGNRRLGRAHRLAGEPKRRARDPTTSA